MKECCSGASSLTESSWSLTASPLCFLSSLLLTFCPAAVPSTCIPFTVSNGTHKELEDVCRSAPAVPAPRWCTLTFRDREI